MSRGFCVGRVLCSVSVMQGGVGYALCPVSLIVGYVLCSVSVVWGGVGYVFFCQRDVGWCWICVVFCQHDVGWCW